jgi:hypothetical protein
MRSLIYNVLRVAEPDEEGRITNARDALLTLTADGEGAVTVSNDTDLVMRPRLKGSMPYAPMSCWSGFTRESAPKAASGELSRGKAHHVDRLVGRCAGGAPIHEGS